MTVPTTPELEAQIEAIEPKLVPHLQMIMDAMERALWSGPPALEEFRRRVDEQLPAEVIAAMDKSRPSAGNDGHS